MARIIIVAVLAAAMATGCGTSATPRPSRTVTPTPTPFHFSFSLSWYDQFLSSDPPTSPPATISDEDFARILDSVGSQQAATIAVDLRSLNKTWRVSGPDLDSFAHDVCFTDARAATTKLLASVPGAELNALAPLTQAVGLVYRTCKVNQPAVINAVSDQIALALVTAHQQTGAAVPTPRPASPKPPSDFDKAACGAGGAVLTGVVKNYVKGIKAGIFGLAVMAAAAVYCPGALGGALGK